MSICYYTKKYSKDQSIQDSFCLSAAFDSLINAGPLDLRLCDDPHTKTNLLFQAHLARLPLPVADYVTDTKGVLHNSFCVLQAMIDVSAAAGWLSNVITTAHIVQVCSDQQCLHGNCIS